MLTVTKPLQHYFGSLDLKKCSMLKLEWFNDGLIFYAITDTQTNKQERVQILNIVRVRKYFKKIKQKISRKEKLCTEGCMEEQA